MIRSLYLHVPFCSSICSYCAFARSANLKQIDAWLDQIEQETTQLLQQARKQNPEFSLRTLYFGGGTPSILDERQLKRLCGLFEGYLDPDAEWTVEANPDSLTKRKALILKEAGVNRISLGIQSFDDQTLKKLGRKHTALQACQSVSMLRQAGFENISADLIIACPWQSLQEIRQDLDALIGLDLPHYSLYTLILEEESVFGKTGLEPSDPDFEADAYELATASLKKAGYVHYEISSFARDGCYSRHNLAYWMDEPYYAVGYGACGREENGWTYHHRGSLKDYLANGYQKEWDDNPDPAYNALLMGLRTSFGIDLNVYQRKYGIDLMEKYADIWKKYQVCLENNPGFLVLNEQGREILDSILLDLLDKD